MKKIYLLPFFALNLILLTTSPKAFSIDRCAEIFANNSGNSSLIESDPSFRELFDSTIKQLDEMIIISDSQVMDVQITDFLQGPARDLQIQFRDAFRDSNDVVQAVLSDLKLNAGLKLAADIEKDLGSLMELAAAEKSFAVRMKALVPKLVDHQIQINRDRIRENHRQALDIIEQMRAEADALSSFDAKNRQLKIELRRQLELQMLIRENVQTRIYEAKRRSDVDGGLMLNALLISIDTNVRSLTQSLTIIESLDIQIKKASLNNVAAFNKLSYLVSGNIPSIEAVVGNKGIDLSPAKPIEKKVEPETTTTAAAQPVAKPNVAAPQVTKQSRIEKLEIRVRELQNFKDPQYFKAIEKIVKNMDDVSLDEFLWLRANLRQSPEVTYDNTDAVVFERAPFVVVGRLMNWLSAGQAIVLSPLRLPLLLTSRTLLGRRVFLNYSQLIYLEALRNLDISKLNINEFERLKSCLANMPTAGYYIPERNMGIYNFFNFRLINYFEAKWLKSHQAL